MSASTLRAAWCVCTVALLVRAQPALTPLTDTAALRLLAAFDAEVRLSCTL